MFIDLWDQLDHSVIRAQIFYQIIMQNIVRSSIDLFESRQNMNGENRFFLKFYFIPIIFFNNHLLYIILVTSNQLLLQ